MGLIGKIRDNSWIILVLIGLALASFIVQAIWDNGSAFGKGANVVGEIAGQEVNIQDFSKLESTLYSGYADANARKSTIWNYFVEKAIVDKENEALGLGVGHTELMDLQFGSNLSPIIKSNFRTPEGGVDMGQLQQIKQLIEGDKDINPNFKTMWGEQEKQIIKTKLQEKISNLVNKAMYAPKWLVQASNKLNTETVSFNYVKVPFDNIDDSAVKLTDADYASYLEKNKHKYQNKEESRLLNYLAFNVVPTSSDSLDIKTKVDALLAEFKTTTNDSLFTSNNGGGVSPVYNGKDKITGPLKDAIGGMSINQVFGPYVENGSYVLAKLLDRKVIPDSVKARHILKRTNPQDPNSLAKAKATIDSIKTVLVNRKSTFDTLAFKYSEDPGSGSKGGDLGTFAQGAMVAPFDKACFDYGKEGNYYVVETQFGVHLIEIKKRIFNSQEAKYKLGIIGVPIVPSDNTVEKREDEVAGILAKNRDMATLKKNFENNKEVPLQLSGPVKINDYNFGNFGSGEASRDLVRWAFKAKKGDVSPEMYKYTDEVNFYVKTIIIAGLENVVPIGTVPVEVLKTSIESLVKNQKKGEMIAAKMKGTDLNAIAQQFGVAIDTAMNVNFNSSFIPKLGAAEPKVVSKTFAGKIQDFSASPIIGNSGVFVYQIIDKQQEKPITDENAIRAQLNNQARSGAGYRIWDALKTIYKPKDNRSKFF